ncbi:MAG: signal peptidase I [Ruminococcaceae bacterium]|nr:signal peptidase I [Oscillospiraceae bacterium]
MNENEKLEISDGENDVLTDEGNENISSGRENAQNDINVRTEIDKSETKPKKPRAPRKKTVKTKVPDGSTDSLKKTEEPTKATQVESEAEKESANEPERSDAEEITAPSEESNSADLSEPSREELENQISIPLFSISAKNFEISLENDEGETVIKEEPAVDSGDFDGIIPPDQLFAYKTFEAVRVDTADTDDETEEVLNEITTVCSSDENIDDDGQYTIADLDLQSDISDKTYTDEEMPKYDPKKPRRIDGRFDFVELFVFTLLAVMIITTFFFRHSIVEGSSMENTLHSGEHLIISDFFYTPKRGDIIVCEDYTTEIRNPIVKRVIAIEGDRVTVSPTGAVTINGEPLVEDYVYVDAWFERPPVDLVVPKGEIFVMGDHRNASKDSREIGTISVDSVLGKVLLRFYPFTKEKFGPVK